MNEKAITETRAIANGVTTTGTTGGRSNRSVRWGLALFITAAMSLGLVAQAGEPTLTLNAKHLGMSREQLSPKQLVVEAPAEVMRTAPAAEVVPAPTAAKSCPTAAAAGAAVKSYEACLETSIRAENSYDESAKVCRALFP